MFNVKREIMKERVLMLFACLFASVMMAMAQTSRVTGTVVDESGEPVIGASVLVDGTQRGAVTNIDGVFVIENVPATAETITVSYVGFQTQKLTITRGREMNIVLRMDAEMLDEVMVVAYGTAKKSSFTGSASVVSTDKLELRPITSVTNGLEGQTTGVLMTSASGQPGSSGSIRVRGYGSINASQDPLYVVDGIPYDGALNSLNPSDIESMTILKDASAGALYGARGANGVVLITTKRGKEGKAQVSWRSTVGWSSRAIPQYELTDQKEFVQLTYEALRNDYAFNGGYAWADAEAIARQRLGVDALGNNELYNPFKNYTWDQLIDPTTGKVHADAQAAWDENWFDAVKRNNAFRHEHQFSLNGGTDKTKYMFSLGYLNEDGILKTTAFERYSARSNVSSQVTDWFNANLNVNLTHSVTNFMDYDGTSTSNVWYTAQFISPLLPLYVKDLSGNNVLDANGNPQLDWGDISGFARPGTLNDFNSLGMLTDDKADRRRDAAGLRTGFTFGSDSENMGWAQGLKLAINFGLDYNTDSNMSYMNMYHGNQATAGGLLSKERNRTQSYTFNQLLTWDRTFGKHSISLLAGHEYYAYKYEYLSAGKTNLVDGILELRPGTTMYDADSYTNNYRINSWLGRAQYNFDDKYYVDGSIRRDGSSRFYKDSRWGTFWSVGANWRVSKEAFMQDIEWINNLSAKISYGEQGNDAIGTFFAWQSLYNLSYANGNNIGGVASSLENKDLGWEKNANFNVGIEGAFFDNRVRLTAEYYNRKTKDMLLSYPMALSTGFSGFNSNVGDMRNTGFAFELGVTPVRTDDFEWNVRWMGSTQKNKVLHLTAESPEILNGSRIIKEGMALNTFYFSKSAGVDPATGAQLYWAYEKDENGDMIPGTEYITDDYTVANNHKYYMGSRIPDLYGSISTDLSWKGFDLNILATYSIGGKIYDTLYKGAMDNMYYNNNFHKNLLRRWQQPGDITDIPRAEINSKTASYIDTYLTDASYFAIKNITLGYTLPTTVVSGAGLEGVRVFGSVDNLALWTHMKGMDPQYSFSGTTDYSYAPNKTWTLGIEVKF